MRSAAAAMLVLIIAVIACGIPLTRNFPASAAALSDSSYIMVGGQNGTWFQAGQDPRLEKISLRDFSVTPLTPAPTQGVVWGGGWNGSQWLISGWGHDYGPNGSDPYIFLYNGISQTWGGSLEQYQAESTWHGGDIFSASSNGTDWLLSGLGSGNLPSYGDSNHMALGIFDGNKLTDLSASVPNQRDFILYTNVWNGKYWLIGGGYMDGGALFSYDGKNIVDLTSGLAQAVPSLASVQSLAWNGYYWLIGGVGFLATYDGHKFTDLTPQLDSMVQLTDSNAVNAIAWDGEEWVLGGGVPVTWPADYTAASRAWLLKYEAGRFTDLTSKIIPPVAETILASSILSIAASDGWWIIGGYSNGRGSLIEYTGNSFSNLSNLVDNYTYVNWVGARIFQEHIQTLGKPYRLDPINTLLLSSERRTMEMSRPQPN